MSPLNKDKIEAYMNHIRTSSLSDFVAIALPIEESSRYRWSFVSGNTNKRVGHMLFKRGKGLPGMALLLGKDITVERNSMNRADWYVDCPLMIAEGLQAAAALLIPNEDGRIGVLMVGSRQATRYDEGRLQELQLCAIELTTMLNITECNR